MAIHSVYVGCDGGQCKNFPPYSLLPNLVDYVKLNECAWSTDIVTVLGLKWEDALSLLGKVHWGSGGCQAAASHNSYQIKN